MSRVREKRGEKENHRRRGRWFLAVWCVGRDWGRWGGEWVAVGYRRVGDDVVQAKEKSPR